MKLFKEVYRFKKIFDCSFFVKSIRFKNIIFILIKDTYDALPITTHPKTICNY